MKKKIKNILVTGGAGYIGSHIVEQLIKTRAKVFIIDNLSTGSKKNIPKKRKKTVKRSKRKLNHTKNLNL